MLGASGTIPDAHKSTPPVGWGRKTVLRAPDSLWEPVDAPIRDHRAAGATVREPQAQKADWTTLARPETFTRPATTKRVPPNSPKPTSQSPSDTTRRSPGVALETAWETE